MMKVYESQSALARQLDMSRNELRFMTQLAIGRILERGGVPHLTRVGTSIGYDESLRAEVMKLVPAFRKGRDVYLGK
jgi:hypothetical protein